MQRADERGPPPVRLRDGIARARAGGGAVADAASDLGLPAAAVELLFGRGVDGIEAQRRWIEPRLAHLRPPDGMAGFADAVELLSDALRRRLRVGVFGDYDVDGVTTAAIVTTYLEALGLEVVARVAARDAGYGFGVAEAEALREAGAKLVVLGDCGTSDEEALGWLRERGISSVVVDHHQMPETRPPADALINPHQPGCRFPFRGMCSAGVAFYLCAALRTRLATTSSQELPDPRAWLDLVALGTVCDMVPLREENHVLARRGLDRLQARERPGLRALLHQAGVDPDERVDEGHLAFQLGPRLNAPGRLGEAEPALVLLRARTASEAMALAQQVEALNRRRKLTQARVVAEAHALVEAQAGEEKRAGLVVAHEGWPAGIVGIAAADLAERHGRPAVVLAIDVETGEARGSARTRGAIDVYEALRSCAELLTRCGGHPQAAGVTLPAGNVAALADAFDRAIASQGGDAEADEARLVDGMPDLSAVDEELLRAIERVGPFGVGFAPPLYLCEQAVVEGARVLKGSHLGLVLRQGKATRDAIAFRQGDVGVERGDQVACLYRPRFNTFRGRRRIQLDVERIWCL